MSKQKLGWKETQYKVIWHLLSYIGFYIILLFLPDKYFLLLAVFGLFAGGSKPVTVETGATVYVPFFVNVGDDIVVDTRTGSYMSRA